MKRLEDNEDTSHIGLIFSAEAMGAWDKIQASVGGLKEKRLNTVALIKKAMDCMNALNYKGALDAFEEIIDVEADVFYLFPDLYYWRGICFLMEGYSKSAGICFEDLYKLIKE